jgi:hypothetical protein
MFHGKAHDKAIINTDKIVSDAYHLQKVNKSRYLGLYDHFQQRGTFNVEDAAKVLYPEQDPPSVELQYSIYMFLKDNPKWFEAESREGNIILYACRDKAEIEFINKLERNQKALLVTCKKVGENIMIARRSGQASKAVPYDENDLQILKGLLIYSASADNISPSPYFQFVKKFMSRVGSQFKFSPEGCREMLEAAGFLRKWDNLKIIGPKGLGSAYELINAGVQHYDCDELQSDGVDEMLEHRRDFGNMSVFTIDSSDTLDVDDGLSIEFREGSHPWFHIHIADPSVIVKPNSRLFADALKRASSCYLAGRTINMIPDSLVTSMSMEPGRSNKTLTVSVCLDEQGKLHDYKVGLSLIQNVKKISKCEANSYYYKEKNSGLFQLPDEDHEMWKFPLDLSSHANLNNEDKRALDVLEKYAYLHSKVRQMDDVRVFNLPSLHLVKTAKSFRVLPFEVSGSPRFQESPLNFEVKAFSLSPASMVVQEFMIIAALVFAKYCHERNIPVLFKSQTKPEFDFEPSFNNEVFFTTKDSLMLIRKLTAGALTTMPSENYTANSQLYAQLTSPIRRANDLINHIQFKSFVKDKKAFFQESYLSSLAEEISKKQITARRLSRMDFRFWMQQMMRNKGFSDVFNGYVMQKSTIDGFYDVWIKEHASGILMKWDDLQPATDHIGRWIRVSPYENEQGIRYREVKDSIL